MRVLSYWQLGEHHIPSLAVLRVSMWALGGQWSQGSGWVVVLGSSLGCSCSVASYSTPQLYNKDPYQCRVLKETGSHILGSWNKEARADSSLYRVRVAAVVAVCNCIIKASRWVCA